MIWASKGDRDANRLSPCNLDLMNSGGSLHVSREKITQIGVAMIAMAGKKNSNLAGQKIS